MAAKKPLKLKGYTALGGSSRKYRTPTGKIISRREYDNRRLKKEGWKNRSEAERFRTGRLYTEKRDKLERAGRKPRELDIFSDWAAFVRDVDWEKVDEIWDTVQAERESGEPRIDPDGPLAEVLTLEGMRFPEWEWAVGDTPSGKRAVV